MAEETLWSGTSSQLKNPGAFLLCILMHGDPSLH